MVNLHSKGLSMLSTNSVFHFTRSVDIIEKIISEGFRLKYCHEKFVLSDSSFYELQVPMVSFCDIPISQIKNHITSYGHFGIGLTKEWAENKRLNPVLYISKNSNVASSIISISNQLDKNGKKDKNINADEFPALDILRYIKNFQGDLERKDRDIEKNYRFSDEREWRYVPEYSEEFKGYLPPRSEVERVSNFENFMKPHNQKISSMRLKVELADINYIILKSESCVSEFIDLLKKDKDILNEDFNRLISRILTVDQIESDF